MLLNRKMVKDLRAILDDALNDNESLEQFIVDIGSANFNDTEVTFKVNLRMKGAKSQSQKDLEFYGNMHNLDLTKIAKLDGKDFSLSGFRRKARTKPYLMKDIASGNEYIATPDTVKMHFSKDNALHIGQEVH